MAANGHIQTLQMAVRNWNHLATLIFTTVIQLLQCHEVHIPPFLYLQTHIRKVATLRWARANTGKARKYKKIEIIKWVSIIASHEREDLLRKKKLHVPALRRSFFLRLEWYDVRWLSSSKEDNGDSRDSSFFSPMKLFTPQRGGYVCLCQNMFSPRILHATFLLFFRPIHVSFLWKDRMAIWVWRAPRCCSFRFMNLRKSSSS